MNKDVNLCGGISAAIDNTKEDVSKTMTHPLL